MKKTILPSLLTMAILLVTACSIPNPKAEDMIHPMETQLENYLSDELAPEELAISFSGPKGFGHDDERYMTINGLGEWESGVNILSFRPRGNVGPEKVNELVELLLEMKAWEQHFYKSKVIDTGKTTLTIQAGDEEVTIWEWKDELEENNHIIQVIEMMQDFKNKSWGLEVNEAKKMKIKTQLEDLLSGELNLEEFNIKFNDYRFFHGLLELEINGLDEIKKVAVGFGMDSRLAPLEKLEPEQVNELIEFLLEVEIWKQENFYDVDLESMGEIVLVLNIAGEVLEVHKWMFDYKEDDPVLQVMEKMKELVWPEGFVYKEKE